MFIIIIIIIIIILYKIYIHIDVLLLMGVLLSKLESVSLFDWLHFIANALTFIFYADIDWI